MKKLRYTKERIKELLKNKYVKNCTQNSIIFTKECKYEVLKLSSKWLFYREIFEKLWFPEYIINSRVPELCLGRWKRNMKITWVAELKKWRIKKEKCDISKMSKDEELEYLRAKVAYLEELKKLVDWEYP